jgi:rod shape-determining protein MreB
MLLLRKPRLTALGGRDVAVCVPAGARAADAAVLAGVVASATGGKVLVVESALAAAIGAGLDISQSATRLVCDIGAGVTEMTVVGDGQVMAESGLRMDVRAYDDEPERALHRVVEMFHRVLDRLPERTAADAIAQPLLVVGGGAMRSDLVTRLADACYMPVQIPNEPRSVVVNGLGNCVPTPLVAASAPA